MPLNSKKFVDVYKKIIRKREKEVKNSIDEIWKAWKLTDQENLSKNDTKLILKSIISDLNKGIVETFDQSDDNTNILNSLGYFKYQSVYKAEFYRA